MQIEELRKDDDRFFETEIEINPRTVQNLRNRYLSKLSYTKSWYESEAQRQRHKNLIIFDWDDTLFSTSAFNPKSEHDVEKIAHYN